MEECRKFQITLRSAQDLPDVRERFRMKVYAEVSFAGDSRTKRKTPADKERETNPAWNFIIGFTIGSKAVEYQGVMLVIKLYCKRKLGDRYIGEVNVSFKDLFDGAAANGRGRSSGTVSYPVKSGGEDSQGVLKFSYSFGGIVMVKKPPPVWARNLTIAGMIIVRVVLASTLGIDVDIPFYGEDVPVCC